MLNLNGNTRIDLEVSMVVPDCLAREMGPIFYRDITVRDGLLLISLGRRHRAGGPFTASNAVVSTYYNDDGQLMSAFFRPRA